MAYKGTDFYLSDRLLSDEERDIRDAVRDLVDEKVLPIIEDHFKAGTFPNEIISEVAEMGLLGASLEGYGCAGLGAVAYGLTMQELERGDSGLRSFVSVQGSLCMYPIHRFGSEEQKQRWLPGMAKGELIGCFGLTEADHGSDPAGMVTHAKRKGDDWVISGEKMWITNGCIADVAIVWARDDEGVIRGFLVEKGMKGYTTNLIENKWSLKASVTSELLFDEVVVPESNRLPEAKGLGGPLSCLNQARYGIAWGGVGAAMAVYEVALKYAQERKQFDRPIGSFQLVQQKLVQVLSDITKGQLLCIQLGRLKEAGVAEAYHVSLAKRDNIKMALDAARNMRDVLGAAGICHDYPMGRHAMNLESVYTYEGTHDIHTLIIGHAATGLKAFT
ncbi:MAG: acyl-CoA dehydrogenase family protein [Acidobacteriota bacterium]